MMENRITAVVYMSFTIPVHIMVLRCLKSSFRNKEFYGRNLAFSFVVASHLLCGIPQLLYVFWNPVENKPCRLKKMIFLYAHHVEDFVTTSSLLIINLFFLKKLHWCLRQYDNPIKNKHLLFGNVAAFMVTINAIVTLYFMVSFTQNIDECRTMFPRNIYMFCFSYAVILLLNLVICSKCLATNSYRFINIHNNGMFAKLGRHVIILTGINILTMIIYFPLFVLQNKYFFPVNESFVFYWIYRLKILLLPALYLVYPDLEANCYPRTNKLENETYLTVVHRASDEDLSQIHRRDANHALSFYEQPRNLSESRGHQGSHSEDTVNVFGGSNMSLNTCGIQENHHIYEDVDKDLEL